MTDTHVLRIATGETRQITTWFEGGWFNCPWCGAANPPEAEQTQHCDNPACWVSKYATAETSAPVRTASPASRPSASSVGWPPKRTPPRRSATSSSVRRCGSSGSPPPLNEVPA